MRPLIIANWKLNPTSQKEAKQLFEAVKEGAKNKNTEMVICPPFVYLPLLKGLTLGAQDVFWEEKGAFTGEVSPLMLKDLNVAYVIVGHSERRKHFAETDIMINKKIKKALSVKLKPVVCVGETFEEKNNKSEILERQIGQGLKGITRDGVKNVVIAYEPIWAIGTGNNCSIDQTMGSVVLIRKIISQLYNREIADHIAILYGGSVNRVNAALYVKDARTNGLLVGASSLNAKEFVKIVKSI